MTEPSERPDPEAPKIYAQLPFRLPPGTSQVVLVRHGASAAHVPGTTFPLVDGHGDPPLAPEGEAQAVLVGERLRREDLAAIYVTTLTRTHQTAAPLADHLGLVPVVVPELREVFLGEWEGGEFRVRVAGGDPLAVQMASEERWEVIPGAEPSDAFTARVRAGVDAIAAKHVGETAVAFTHGGVVAEACRQATNSRPWAFVGAENGGITRLVVHPDGMWRLRTYNDVSHLG